MTILVWGDSPTFLAELATRGRLIAERVGWDVAVLLPGDAALDESVNGVVDVVYRVTPAARPDDPDAWVDAISSVAAHARPELMLIGASKLGLEVAPRVAQRMGAGYAPWAVGLEVDGPSGGLIARCTSYAGAGETTYRFKPGTIVATVAGGAPERGGSTGSVARVETIEVSYGAPRVSALADQPKAIGERLETARAIVDVGQGVRQREDLQLVAGLAGLLDARVACTRPVAADRDWFPEWLGLSGTKVSPELCLAIGVSGAIQHIVGIRASRIIAAVNNDETAAIFSGADVGVVADLYEFLPVLIERLRARGIRPAWDAE